MAHIVLNEQFTVFIGVIPALQIIEFIEALIEVLPPGKLKKYEDCRLKNGQPLNIASFPTLLLWNVLQSTRGI